VGVRRGRNVEREVKSFPLRRGVQLQNLSLIVPTLRDMWVFPWLTTEIGDTQVAWKWGRK
jgi:hypothetical protein